MTINPKRDLIFLERFVSSPHHAHLKTGWCLFVFVHLYQGTLISQTKEKRNKNSENVDVDFNNFTKFGNKQKKKCSKSWLEQKMNRNLSSFGMAPNLNFQLSGLVHWRHQLNLNRFVPPSFYLNQMWFEERIPSYRKEEKGQGPELLLFLHPRGYFWRATFMTDGQGERESSGSGACWKIPKNKF